MALARGNLRDARPLIESFQKKAMESQVPSEIRRSHELQGMMAIVEKNYRVDITNKLAGDEEILGSIEDGKHISFEKPVHVAVDVNEALEDSKVAIRFPFYNANAQNFMEIKFADNSEIVMCSC